MIFFPSTFDIDQIDFVNLCFQMWLKTYTYKHS